MPSRREALKRLGLLAAGAAVGAGCAHGSRGGYGRPGGADPGGDRPDAGGGGRAAPAAAAGRLDRIGIQLYTLREAMARDVGATLDRVAEMGYDEVEFAGWFGHEPGEVRRLVTASGLDAPSAHVDAALLGDGWPSLLDAAAAAGHRYVVVPWLPRAMRGSLDAWRRTGALLDRAGEEARAAGLRLAYHNQAYDSVETGGRTPLDVLCEATDPELVDIELDLFWIVDGGGDPVAFMERWPGRTTMVHAKDRTSDGRMVDVGAGVLDFAGILAHPAAAAVRHVFAEHDEPGDPFASARASYAALAGVADVGL